MSKSIFTSIVISAPPVEIWNCLVDFSSYPDWNPFIYRIDGKPGRGEFLTSWLQMVDGSKMKFKPKIVEYVPQQKLAWLGRFLVPGLFDGRHEFELILNSDGTTTFRHSEVFRGIFVSILWRGMESKIRESFQSMNEALKTRVERHSST